MATSACAGLIGANFDKAEDPDFGELEANSGGAGAKDAPAGPGGVGGDAPSLPEDTVPPTVVSVIPSDGAKGIGEGQAIVVEFSEPMNQGMTEAAFRSEELPAGSASFEWNADGTVLTIDPDEPLPYATGGEDVAAFSVTYSFDGAKDLAGNALGVEKYSFSTMRRIVYELLPSYSGSRKIGVEETYTGGGNDYVGGGGTPPSVEHIRGVVKFDLTSLPKLTESKIQAHLRGSFGSVTGGDPFFLYGPLAVGRITDATTFETEFKSMESETALGYVTGYGDYDVDISSSFRADFLNRTELGNVVAYGYYFPSFKVGYIARAGFTTTLRLEYLEP